MTRKNHFVSLLLLAVLVVLLAAIPAVAQDGGTEDGIIIFVDWEAKIVGDEIVVYGITESGERIAVTILSVPTSDDSETDNVEGYVIVNVDNLNIRSGPGPQFTVLGVVDGGTKLVPIGRNKQRTWWYVEFEGISGWINATLTIARGNLVPVPIVPAQGEIIKPTLVVFVAGNFVYPDLETGSAPACVLPANSEHVITGRSPGGSYYLIEANCTDGTVKLAWVDRTVGVERNPAGIVFPVIDYP